MKNEYIPCKDCAECTMHTEDNSHHFHCKLQGQAKYKLMKDMIFNCPIRSRTTSA